MSSGGGGTNTVSQTIPDWMQGYIQNNYQFGKEVASIPYTPYGGEAVAPLNATQQQGMQQLQNLGASNAGMQAIQTGVNGVSAAAGYNPSTASYNAPSASNIQQYLSPYLGQVMDTTNQAIRQQGDIANQQTAGNATAAGAYGGSRQAVQTALNNYYTGQNIAQADANIQNTGYAQAMQQASTNAQADLAAQEANQQAGLTANQQRTQAGLVLGNLGNQQASTGALNAENVINAGSIAQQAQQQRDTYNLQQYLAQLQWPYQQLGALTGSMYGGNVGGSTTSPTYSNTAGQIAGLGMAGLGLAGSLGWLGSGAAAGGAAAGAGATLADAAILLA